MQLADVLLHRILGYEAPHVDRLLLPWLATGSQIVVERLWLGEGAGSGTGVLDEASIPNLPATQDCSAETQSSVYETSVDL